ncbi:MAG TPA: PKD domain-containing protein, partial [Taishania sp.]|nr:PKD domain-containing protein [Taishania sp.]
MRLFLKFTNIERATTFLLFSYVLITSFVTAQVAPTAQFSGSTSVCVGEAANFTNQSVQGNSPITAYTWDFGDGNSATTQHATHVYATPGTYTVTLVVQAANGQADSEVKVNYIVVNPKPTANFSFTTNGCTLPVGVIFANSSTGANTYSWNFGNGQTSTLPTPTVVNYTTPNTYTTTLIVTSAFGCKDTISQQLIISNFQSGIDAPTTACAGTPVTISDNSTAGVNSYNWNFEGGSPASSSAGSVNVVYNTPGTYNISLTSQNTSLGCSSSATKQITILPKPAPSFTNTPTVGCAPLTVNFTNTGHEAGATYVWSFGNGDSSTLVNPSTTYTGNGSYTVTLTMTGANGCSATAVQNAVNLTSPVADFTSNVVNGCADLDVQFTSTSTSADPIAQWNWTFGDGTTFSGQNPPVHSYPVGVYDVTLVVVTQNGCTDTITKLAYIKVGEINSMNFSIDESPQCVKTDIDFTDLSVISAPHTQDEVTYYWTFGDGGSSTDQNPSHQYASDTGYFDVSLIINFRGCIDTFTITDAVYIKAPLSRFSLSQTLFCNPASLPVTLNATDNAIIGVLSDDCEMIWRWGDGATTTLDNATLDGAGN